MTPMNTPTTRSPLRKYRRWTPLPEGWRATFTRSGRRRWFSVRLYLEQLEDLTLPSGSISGNIFNGDDLIRPVEPALAGWMAYLDLNHNGRLDARTSTSLAQSTIIGPAPGALGSFGGFMSALSVQGLSGSLTNLGVTLDLANRGTSSVVVAVISPVGLTVPNLPNLFTIRPGEHFTGTFDGNSTNPVAGTPRPLPSGTYAPEQSFVTPLSYVDGTDPNGTWGLVFFGDTSGLDLQSWSLTFTSLEPTATTDSNGYYSFQGLAAGNYDVRPALSAADVQTAPVGNVARSVQVVDGRDAAGIDFAVRPAPDLTGVSFGVANPATAWGQPVSVNYTLTNQGGGKAGPFDVDVRLSSTGRIGAAGPLLRTLHFDGLAAHASASGSVMLTLPDRPPVGFGGTPTDAYLGLLIDPLNAVNEADELNNSNQAAGIDLALADGTNGVRANTSVASGAKVQQDPSIAADPTNASHLVTAFMDYSLSTTGYAGIGIATSFNGGATWSRGSIPFPVGFDQGAASPTVVFDAQGGVHVSFQAATFLGTLPTLTAPDSSQRRRGFLANNGIFVSSSTDGGRTWDAPVAVASHLYTPGGPKVPFEVYPAIAVDTSSTLPDGRPNPNVGSLYVAWARFYPPGQFPGQTTSSSGSDVMLAVSRDGGATWQTQTQIDPSTRLLRSVILDPNFKDNGTGGEGRGFITFPAVTVGRGGDVYVSTFAGGNFTIYHSANGGRTFTPPDYNGQTGLAFPTITTNIVPSPSLALGGFRTLPLRQIVADPSRAGRVYAVAVNAVTAQVGAQAGGGIDPGDVLFASSDDYGQTWTSNFTVLKEPPILSRLTPAQIGSYTPTLNDDNGGQPAGIVQQLSTQVLSGQALPSLTVDASGNVVVIWYDTRSDPNGFGRLGVWGTVSTDGGKIFSPNFQITDATFDPSAGAFRAGAGRTSFYLGDQIGVVVAGNTAYAVWTDTRAGGQDVYLGQYPIFPAPFAPSDRYSPNFSLATATELGPVNTPRDLPRLTLAPGQSNEWFRLEAAADGQLIVSVRTDSPGGDLHVQIADDAGVVQNAASSSILDASGAGIGTRLVVPGAFGVTYLVHAFGDNPGALKYNLSVSNLTGDLGPQVQSSVGTSLTSGGQNAYRLAAGVAGTLTISLAAGANLQGGLVLKVLTPDAVNLLGQGDSATPVSLPVTQGQEVLVLVFGADPASQGSFNLHVTNADQYGTSGGTTVFLPTIGTPTSVAVADFNRDGKADLFATSTDIADAVSAFAGNGDGTFQAPRQFDVGAGLRGSLTADNRQPVITDVNGDGIPDAIVPNFRSADVSVLLGRGDGTFEPQRRFDAVTSPDFTAVGDFNGDGIADLVVLQNFPQLGSVSQLAILIGQGSATFTTPVLYRTAFTQGAGPVVVGDFTGDGKLDLLVFSKNTSLGQLYRGLGDGTFADSGTFRTPENAFSVLATDLDGNGALDLVFAGTNSGNVYTTLGNGDGTFQAGQKYVAMIAGPGDNVGIYGVAFVNFAIPDTAPLPFPPKDLFGVQLDYGPRSLILTAASRSGQGKAQVIAIPELIDPDGHFAGFSKTPVVLALTNKAGDLATGDFNGDGATDVAVVDAGGLTVVYGRLLSVPVNNTAASARMLAAITHYVTPTLSIVEGHSDAYYKFTVPVEVAAGSGDQVIDISALFQYTAGIGLQMDVLDSAGNVLGSGERIRLTAAQGAELTVHVFGLTAFDGTRGSGAYTLDIDVLPQVVSAQATAFLPGGPATSIVLTLQGDRLDPATAENPANYTVTWLGPNGQTRIVPIGSIGNGQPVVYNPGANSVTSSGLTYPTAVRQTVTLLFSEALRAGSYRIDVSAAVQTAAFTPLEAGLLAGGSAFAGHPLTSVANGSIQIGTRFVATDLVGAGNAPASLSQFNAGTPFLTQLQNDLGALLDARLLERGDDPSISQAMMDDILARLLPGLDPSGNTPILVIWLDPVSVRLADSEGSRTVYNESTRAVTTGMRNTFVEVGGNVELVVVAGASGTFALNVGTVDAASRGGAAILGVGSAITTSLTAALRGGITQFSFTIPTLGAGGPSASATSGGSDATGGGGSSSALSQVISLLLVNAINPGSISNGSGGTDGRPDIGSDANAGGAGADVAAGPIGPAYYTGVETGSRLVIKAIQDSVTKLIFGKMSLAEGLSQVIEWVAQPGWLQRLISELPTTPAPAQNGTDLQFVDWNEQAVGATSIIRAIAPLPRASTATVLPAQGTAPLRSTDSEENADLPRVSQSVSVSDRTDRMAEVLVAEAVVPEGEREQEGRKFTAIGLTAAALSALLVAHFGSAARSTIRDRARELDPHEVKVPTAN